LMIDNHSGENRRGSRHLREPFLHFTYTVDM
jgi:hypothetical protein